jgi:hypothetical protein
MKLKFGVSPGQIEVQSVDTVVRWRDFVVIEIVTAQKYPEIPGWNDAEILIGPSQFTFADSYRSADPPTVLHLPPELQGWEACPRAGEWGNVILVAFYKPMERESCTIVTLPAGAPGPWDGRIPGARDRSAPAGDRVHRGDDNDGVPVPTPGG